MCAGVKIHVQSPLHFTLVLLLMQVAVQSFKLAWNFTDGESMSGGANVSAPFVADTLAGHQVGAACTVARVCSKRRFALRTVVMCRSTELKAATCCRAHLHCAGRPAGRERLCFVSWRHRRGQVAAGQLSGHQVGHGGECQQPLWGGAAKGQQMEAARPDTACLLTAHGCMLSTVACTGQPHAAKL